MTDDFWRIHSDLPREGPGSAACTARALALAQPLPPHPRLLDVGCGPGAQTADLVALLPGADITAVDRHAPFLQQLRRRCPAVRVLCADMAELPIEPGSLDLIWCEGAVYFLGIEQALRRWRPLLKPDGRIAFTEPVWLQNSAPPEVREFWREYPGMRSIAEVRAAIRSCSYELLGDFVLDEQAWWNYYDPLEQRLQRIRDQLSATAWQQAQHEIDMYRRYSAYYGYSFFVVRSSR